MSINYRVIKAKSNLPNKEGKRECYRAQVVQNQQVSLDELAKWIEETSAHSASDVKALVEQLAEAAVKYLKLGQGVNLGEIGTMTPTVQSDTTGTKKEFTYRNIRKVGVRFTPSSVIKKGLEEVRFHDLDAKE